jgi:hypothetical protein
VWWVPALVSCIPDTTVYLLPPAFRNHKEAVYKTGVDLVVCDEVGRCLHRTRVNQSLDGLKQQTCLPY